MGDARMTATRYSRRDASDHEYSTRGGIFKDRHIGTSQTAMEWMVRNVGESFLNIVGSIEKIFGLHRRLEDRIAEVEDQCMANEANSENLRDEMEELKEKVENMRIQLNKKK